MSAANPNSMEKSMVSVLVVANAGGGSPLPCVICKGIVREWQSRTYNTNEYEGREASRGSMEASKDMGGWGVRSDGKGQGRPGGDNQQRK
jgi:hypothetical protein